MLNTILTILSTYFAAHLFFKPIIEKQLEKRKEKKLAKIRAENSRTIRAMGYYTYDRESGIMHHHKPED